MRPKWKGTLQIGLVTIPVHLYAATEKSLTPSGHHVHRRCQTQLKQKKWCPACDTEVDGVDVMRGYENPLLTATRLPKAERDLEAPVPTQPTWIELTDDELDSLKVEATHTIAIARVAPVEELDPLLVSGTMYLTGDGTAAAAEAEAVMLAAMAGKVGLGTIVLNQREQRVALMVYGGGFVVQTLRSAASVREMPVMRTERAPDPQLLKLAKQLVATLAGPLDLESTRDAYADGMKALITAKAGGEAVPESQTSATPPVRALKDALLAALEAAPKPTPATMTVVKGRKTGTRG